MDQNFIGPDNLPDNDTIDLGAADEAAILAAETSWRRSLKTNVEGEAAWDAAVGTARQSNGLNVYGFGRLFSLNVLPTRRRRE